LLVPEHRERQPAAAVGDLAVGFRDRPVPAAVVDQHGAVFGLASAHGVREREERRPDHLLLVVRRKDDEDHALARSSAATRSPVSAAKPGIMRSTTAQQEFQELTSGYTCAVQAR